MPDLVVSVKFRVTPAQLTEWFVPCYLAAWQSTLLHCWRRVPYCIPRHSANLQLWLIHHPCEGHLGSNQWGWAIAPDAI